MSFKSMKSLKSTISLIGLVFFFMILSTKYSFHTTTQPMSRLRCNNLSAKAIKESNEIA